MKFIVGQDYFIGNYIIKFNQGKKKINDYLIHWINNGETLQFSDLDFFLKLWQLDSNELKSIINAFLGFKNNKSFIILEDNCIKSVINDVIDVIDYVNSVKKSDIFGLFLASMIFRCDIDNINYDCPRLNGCVRHFIQILMLYGYKAGDTRLQMEKITPYINQNISIPKLISDIGYPNNQYGVSTQDFADAYKKFKKSMGVQK